MARTWKNSSVILKVVSVVFCCVVLIYAVIDTQQFVSQHKQTNSEWQLEIAALSSPTPSNVITLGEVAGVSISTPSTELSGFETAKFIRVVDGDTIKVSLNGEVETVRLVGINAPESVAPQKPVECMGKEASNNLASLVRTDQLLYLEKDETQSNRDRYGRLLRFVFTEDQFDIGLAQIKSGFAQSALYSTRPHKYLSQYQEAETIAQTKNLGLWNLDVCPQ